MTRRPALLLLLLTAGLGCAASAPAVDVHALTGATVIDVVTGRVLPDAVVLIRDGRILSIGAAGEVPVPRGATSTNLAGNWIIPGLIDGHAHLPPWGYGGTLRWGVTTVRDLHGSPPTVRDSTQSAPRIFRALAGIDGAPHPWPGAIVVTTPQEAVAAVDSLVRQGATWIKGFAGLTPSLLDAVVIAARAHRLPVSVHLGLTDALTAVQVGVTSIEHLSGIPEAAGDSIALQEAHRAGFFAGWNAFEFSWLSLDTAVLGRVARDLAVTGVTLVPTLVLHHTMSRLDDAGFLQRPELAEVPDSVRVGWNVSGLTADAVRGQFMALRAARSPQDAFLRMFAAAGGRIVAGTDAAKPLVVPGAAMHLELELLVQAGLSPLEALRAATVHGADLLRADSLGRLRPGAAADLVVLAADPLADIRNSRQIVRVMLRGVWVR